MYERFTDRARKVMQLANQEAQRFNHEYIGTEHILLGLVKEGSGVAANVLKNLDVDLRKIRIEVEKIVQTGPDMVTMGKLPQTPRAKKVIEYAMDEARNLNHNYVGILGVVVVVKVLLWILSLFKAKLLYSFVPRSADEIFDRKRRSADSPVDQSKLDGLTSVIMAALETQEWYYHISVTASKLFDSQFLLALV